MNVHEPPLHDATPLVTAGQLFPQLPQFVTVVCRFVSQALAALPSQLPRLVPQAVQTRLDPLVHAVVSYCRLVHVVQDVQARLDPLEQAVVSYSPVWHVVHAANEEDEIEKITKCIIHHNVVFGHCIFSLLSATCASRARAVEARVTGERARAAAA